MSTETRYTPTDIRKLAPNEIFVFGSNTDGRHGKGAAKFAMQKFGAKWGEGEGLYGQSYALPTVGNNLSRMAADRVGFFVARFLKFAVSRPDLTFLVTLVGCGLAGHKSKVIGPMFKGHSQNVILPKEFVEAINGSRL